MKVYIAGHGGMVGSALVRTASSNVDIVTATRSELDLRDNKATRSFIKEANPDVVILAAAKVGGIEANSTNHRDFLLFNLQIQNSVIDASASLGVPKLLFLGSSCIYPKHATQPISEASLLTGPLEETNEGYALAKIAGIRLCQSIFDQQDLQYFSVMPTNLYGPNDNFSKLSSHVPAALMRKFHEAKKFGLKEVKVWGTGSARREFMHVDDMARACWYMLGQKSGGELINVGTGQDIEIAEFAGLMAKVVGCESNVVYDLSKPDGAPRKLLDVSKIHAYGWKHLIELEDGLKQTYAWFVNALENGEVRGF
jgi:GDP-L-fucose synthase